MNCRSKQINKAKETLKRRMAINNKIMEACWFIDKIAEALRNAAQSGTLTYDQVRPVDCSNMIRSRILTESRDSKGVAL